jgi:hypothetical protein
LVPESDKGDYHLKAAGKVNEMEQKLKVVAWNELAKLESMLTGAIFSSTPAHYTNDTRIAIQYR